MTTTIYTDTGKMPGADSVVWLAGELGGLVVVVWWPLAPVVLLLDSVFTVPVLPVDDVRFNVAE